MIQLHQLKTKLLSDINSNYHLANASNAKEVAILIDNDIDDIFDALGGCEKCFGRGYLVATDLGEFCDCKRADMLEQFIQRFSREISR